MRKRQSRNEEGGIRQPAEVGHRRVAGPALVHPGLGEEKAGQDQQRDEAAGVRLKSSATTQLTRSVQTGSEIQEVAPSQEAEIGRREPHRTLHQLRPRNRNRPVCSKIEFLNPTRSGEQGAISRPKLRPPNLTTENLELVTDHHQLDVLHIRTATTANKQAEQSPNSEIKEGEEHAPILPGPDPTKARPELMAPFS